MSTPQGGWNFGWSVTVAIVTVVGGVLALAAMNKLPTEMFGVRWSNPSLSVQSPITPSPILETKPTNSSSPNELQQPLWKFMGKASTGESVYVDSSSVKKTTDSINFTYKIGNELVDARADCSGNRWYASKYGWSSPSSQATQEMLSYVCKP